MCGIAGIFDEEHPPERETLEGMNAHHEHRGPDDSGIYRDGGIGLAHQRLSIIDLETGQQPIYNEDESVVVVFNGEIYNYRDLRTSLESDGHQFTTETDTEVLVHLYEEEGPEFVAQLEGMFAFALWDSEREQLVLARDPIGIKPLLLIQTDERIGFASELPAILESGIDHGGLDTAALARFFAFGYIPAPHTAFRNVRKLEPGERVIVSSEGIQSSRFYSLSAEERDPGYGHAKAELRSRVREAVRKRLMSDVPLGAFLSGGIDSSIVVGTMAGLLDEPVNTFTVGFQQDRFDESWAAREVATYHDTNHHEYTLSAEDVRDIIPEVLGLLGEPFADQSLIPSYVVARETSRDVRVALSGDGADELFAGYDKYRVESLSNYYRALPRAVRELVIEPAVNSLPSSMDSWGGSVGYRGQWFVNRSGPTDVSNRHFELMRIPRGEAFGCFDSIDPRETGQSDLADYHRGLGRELRDRDSLKRIQAVDTRLSLPNQMLAKVDRASMYNSLEVRVPFLDTSVVGYAMSLPTDYKITGRTRKRILKEAFSDVLPPSIRKRGKQGFDMPIGEWFRHELADEFVSAVRAVDLGILDDDTVIDVFDEHVAAQQDHAKFLWSVYVFKTWGRRMREQGVLHD